MYKQDTPAEPRESYVVADCGHEVYLYEYLYQWDGKTYCPDCMRDEINDLPLNELLELMGGYATENTGGEKY